MGKLIADKTGDTLPDPRVEHVRRSAGAPAMSSESQQFPDAFPAVNGERARVVVGGPTGGPQKRWTPGNRSGA